MGDFSFTSTAECHYCGGLLGSSDAECDDCHEDERTQQFFRRTVGSDEPQTIAVDAVPRSKWSALEAVVGDDWIAYEWLGPRFSVETMLRTRIADSIDDVPAREMAVES